MKILKDCGGVMQGVNTLLRHKTGHDAGKIRGISAGSKEYFIFQRRSQDFPRMKIVLQIPEAIMTGRISIHYTIYGEPDA